jgi:hypothetical protein
MDSCPDDQRQVFEDWILKRLGSFDAFQWDLQQKNGRPKFYARVVDLEAAVQYVLHAIGKFKVGAGQLPMGTDPSTSASPSVPAYADALYPPTPAGEDESQFGFPNAETRRLVEAAAVKHVTMYYESWHYKVVDRQSDNLGYDLDVIDPKLNRTVFKVEVKGTAGESETFYITSNERKCASSNPDWRLAIVTRAVERPTMLEPLEAAAMEEKFLFSVVAWRSTRR